MASANQWQRRLTFGGRLPWTIGLLLSLTVILSLVTAVGERHAGGLFELVALIPALVLRGQVWRLATWLFVEPGPWALLFAGLSLFWFGAPLTHAWGSRRFLVFYVGIMIFAAVGTCLVALFDPAVRESTYLGGWAVGVGLLVAWGLTFPTQVVRFYFLIPIRGYWIAWITVATTVVYWAYMGWTNHLPELLAEAAALGWIYRVSVLSSWWGKRAQMGARAAGRPQRGVVVDFHSGDRVDSERKPN
jgi:membrane associated rhomboid family serine protease